MQIVFIRLEFIALRDASASSGEPQLGRTKHTVVGYFSNLDYGSLCGLSTRAS